jgi:hypothetical protein
MGDSMLSGWIRVTVMALGCLAPLVVQSSGSTQAAENTIFAELTGTGVVVSPGVTRRLPLPTLADDLDAAAQKKAILPLTDANHSWDALVRKSVVAPLVLKHGAEELPGGIGVARRVDLWFIVYGDFAKISDEGFLRQQIESDMQTDNSDQAAKVTALTSAELTQRGIASDAQRDRFFAGAFSLFDRVSVSATLAAMQTRTPNSALVALAIDPRFDQDPQSPNQWKSLGRDDAGKLHIGQPKPYAGAGAYVKATRLVEPAGAVFVEYHLVFNEPKGWFGGANLLASKIPLMSQDGVRKFRRRIVQK